MKKRLTQRDLTRFINMTEQQRNKNFTDDEIEDLETMYAAKMIFSAF